MELHGHPPNLHFWPYSDLWSLISSSRLWWTTAVTMCCVTAGCFYLIMEILKKQSHESPFKIIHLFVTVLYKCWQNSPLLRIIFYTLFSTPKQRAQQDLVFFTCVLYVPHLEEVAWSTCSSPYNETSEPSSCVLSCAAMSKEPFYLRKVGYKHPAKF